MRNKRTAVTALVLSVLGACIATVGTADDGKINLRVKVGDAAESQLIVVDGHRAEVNASGFGVALVPTVSGGEVTLSLTISDAESKIVATPRIRGRFGKTMSVTIGFDSGSSLTVEFRPERSN
jgi:hypothetical protein